MRELRLTYIEGHEMFRRMVFNVLSENCDDHTKNFSFILRKNLKWELAPAYDICFAYRPDSIWVSQHALSVNGKRKDITNEDFLTLAQAMNIKNAKEIIDQVQTVLQNWNTYADKFKVDLEKKTDIWESMGN